MSMSLARANRRVEAPLPSSAKKADAKKLRIGAAGDALEREADRVADRVTNDGTMAEWSFAKAGAGRIQRQPTPDPGSQNMASQDTANQSGTTNQQAPQPSNYKDAAGKLGEAFLQTDVGKKLKDAASKDPLVKGAEDFVGTLPGKIVVGAAATAAVSTLAATHKALPVQIPEIPLDAVHPGLKVKLTYEGAVDHPTKAMITFSFTPGGDKKKKEPSATQRRLAETAPIAASMDEIRAGMSYAPGTPQAQEHAQQQAEEKEMFDNYAMRSIGALPGTGGVPLLPSTGAGQANASASGWTFSSLTRAEQDKKLDLKPAESSTDATLQRKCACESTGEQCDECRKKSELLQRKGTGLAEGFAPPIVDQVLNSSGSPLDRATRDDLEPRFGFDFSRVRVHSDAQAAESARAVSALAYTVGNHIVFGSGRFDPSGPSGRHLLAHELAHVTQQQGGKGFLVQRQTGPVQVDSPEPKECEGRVDITKEFKDFIKTLPELLKSAPDFTPAQRVSFSNEIDRVLQSEAGVNIKTFKVICCDKINSELLTGAENALAEVDSDKKEIRLSKETKQLMDDFKQNKDKPTLARLIETLAHEKRHVTLGEALKVDPKALRPGRPETVAVKAEYRAQEILTTAEELAVGRMAFGSSYEVSDNKAKKLRRQNNMLRGYVNEAEYQRLRAIIISKLRERYGFEHGCDNALTLGVLSSMDHNRWFECVDGAPGGLNPPAPPDLHICEGFCKTQTRGAGPTESEK